MAVAVVLSVVLDRADIGAVGDMALGPRSPPCESFNRYVFPFELVSLVLLAAMIGAIVLARREEERP